MWRKSHGKANCVPSCCKPRGRKWIYSLARQENAADVVYRVGYVHPPSLLLSNDTRAAGRGASTRRHARIHGQLVGEFSSENVRVHTQRQVHEFEWARADPCAAKQEQQVDCKKSPVRGTKKAPTVRLQGQKLRRPGEALKAVEWIPIDHLLWILHRSLRLGNFYRSRWSHFRRHLLPLLHSPSHVVCSPLGFPQLKTDTAIHACIPRSRRLKRRAENQVTRSSCTACGYR